MLTASIYKADVDAGIKDTLKWNQRKALSHLLMVEEHINELDKKEVASAWCAVKHYLLALDHHVSEAIGHTERLGLDNSKYKKFRKKLLDLQVYPEPKLTVKDVVELRTEWRYIIEDPTLTGECEICDKDITPTIKSLIGRKQLKEDNKDYNNPHNYNTLRKTLYSKHTYKNSDKLMDQKEIGIVLAGDSLGVAAHEILMGLDTRYPTFPIKPSLLGDAAGLALAIYGGLNFNAPYDLLAAVVGGYVSMDLYRYIQQWIGVTPTVRVAAVSTPRRITYTTQNDIAVKPTPLANGKYVVMA